jgi:hypothetical protein
MCSTPESRANSKLRPKPPPARFCEFSTFGLPTTRKAAKHSPENELLKFTGDLNKLNWTYPSSQVLTTPTLVDLISSQ